MHASIIDCHTHTNFSDGESSFEENVHAAAAKGCRVLVSTDHLTLPASMDPRCECQGASARFARPPSGVQCRARTLRRKSPPTWISFLDSNATGTRDASATSHSGRKTPGSSLAACIGLEARATPRSQRANAAASALIPPMRPASPQAGSIIRKTCTFGKNSARTVCGVRTSMRGVPRAKALSPSIRWPTPTCLCAFRKMDGRHPRTSKAFGTKWPRARTTLNRRIELSTASLRKGLPDYYPATGLLERFFKAGVSITIGSDAHIASDICFGILEAQKHAFAAGYRTFDVPRADGSWESWNL